MCIFTATWGFKLRYLSVGRIYALASLTHTYILLQLYVWNRHKNCNTNPLFLRLERQYCNNLGCYNLCHTRKQNVTYSIWMVIVIGACSKFEEFWHSQNEQISCKVYVTSQDIYWGGTTSICKGPIAMIIRVVTHFKPCITRTAHLSDIGYNNVCLQFAFILALQQWKGCRVPHCPWGWKWKMCDYVSEQCLFKSYFLLHQFFNI